jgi:hypothetical protein
MYFWKTFKFTSLVKGVNYLLLLPIFFTQYLSLLLPVSLREEKVETLGKEEEKPYFFLLYTHMKTS